MSPARPTPPERPAPIVVVDNPDDDVAVNRHLSDLATSGTATGTRIVIRPTPGATHVTTLGQDALIAVGKSSATIQAERISATAWDLARAWTIGAGVTDIVIDRAHRLTDPQHAALHRLATQTLCRLWLIWSSRQPLTGAHERTGAPIERIDAATFYTRLPVAGATRATPTARPPARWPLLPQADFTVFLAEARRLLSPADFTAVAALYAAVAHATDTWITQRHHLLDPTAESPADLPAALAAWLRDRLLGPAPCASSALVSLRAAQAALFRRGILLAWNPQTLGPEPADRLLGTLTPSVAHALHLICRTDLAAATALSLHLNHPPTDFDIITCADVAPDGSQVWGRQPGSLLAFPAYTSGPYSGKWGLRITTRSFEEMDSEEPIRLPPAARPILAAHLAWRRSQGAADHEPFFTHPRDPGQRSPDGILREGVTRTCRRLGLPTPWVHAGDCRYGHGSDGSYSKTWLGERALTIGYLPAASTIQWPMP